MSVTHHPTTSLLAVWWCEAHLFGAERVGIVSWGASGSEEAGMAGEGVCSLPTHGTECTCATAPCLEAAPAPAPSPCAICLALGDTDWESQQELAEAGAATRRAQGEGDYRPPGGPGHREWTSKPGLEGCGRERMVLDTVGALGEETCGRFSISLAFMHMAASF